MPSSISLETSPYNPVYVRTDGSTAVTVKLDPYSTGHDTVRLLDKMSRVITCFAPTVLCLAAVGAAGYGLWQLRRVITPREKIEHMSAILALQAENTALKRRLYDIETLAPAHQTATAFRAP